MSYIGNYSTQDTAAPRVISWMLVILSFIAFAVTFQSAASAEPALELVNKEPERSLAERTEHLGRLYKNEENNFLQELWLLGRYQGQYHAALGKEEEGYETRRFRLGGQAKLFKQLTLHAQMVSGSDLNPFYNGFTELWSQWAFTPELILTVGQQKHRFTHDRNVSSRYLNYLERAMITNMFAADYTPAVTLQGTVGEISYYSGLFSNATSDDIVDSFTNYDSGHSFLAAAYWNIMQGEGTDSTYLHFSYVNSEANENATNFNRYNNGISVAAIGTRGARSLILEVVGGIGSEEGDSIGLNLQPGWFLTDQLQLVGRYQIASSNDEQGLVPQRRYEQPAGLERSDRYQAGYLGLNYYLLKHRLKLMSGIEYARSGEQDLWTISTMLRFYFGPHSGGAFPMNRMLPAEFFEFD